MADNGLVNGVPGGWFPPNIAEQIATALEYVQTYQATSTAVAAQADLRDCLLTWNSDEVAASVSVSAHEETIATLQGILLETKRRLAASHHEERNARRLAAEAKAERDMAVRALGALKSLTIEPGKVADELMARIEREGAIHRDSLIDVLSAFAAPR